LPPGTGAGGLAQISGTVSLDVANALGATTGTVISGGTLVPTVANALGSATVTLNGGTIYAPNGNNTVSYGAPSSSLATAQSTSTAIGPGRPSANFGANPVHGYRSEP